MTEAGETVSIDLDGGPTPQLSPEQARGVIISLLAKARQITFQLATDTPSNDPRPYMMAIDKLDEAVLWLSATYEQPQQQPDPAIWTPEEGGTIQ